VATRSGPGLADPQIAVILLDLMCSEDTACEPVSMLTAALDEHRRLEPGSEGERSASPGSSRAWAVPAAIRECWLPKRQDYGTPTLILAPSNAAMARLAGMIVGGVCHPTS